MRMVDEVLNTLTKGEHSRTVDLIKERKRMEEEELKIKKAQEEYERKIKDEWKMIDLGFKSTQEETPSEEIDFEGLKSLREIGIDTNFIDAIKPKLMSR